MIDTLQKKKGQIWTSDFIIGLSLFVIMIFVIMKILLSMNIQADNSDTYIDAVHLSSQLVTPGYPKNWTNGTPNPVIIPGVCTSNRINETQLLEFTKISYDRTKTLYHISSDYIFFFTNGTTIINTSQCVYGYPLPTDTDCNPDLTGLDYSDLSKINRMVIFNNTLHRMTIYAWK